MVRFWRTAQRRVCFQKKKGCLFQEPLKEKKTTRKWFVSFLNRRTPQEGEEQEEKSFCFRKEPLVSRTQRKWFFFFFSEQKNTSRRRKTRRKKFLFQKKEEPLFFSSSFLWRKEPLKENGSFLKNRSKKWCFFLLLLCFALLCFALLCFALLVSRIQRNGAVLLCLFQEFKEMVLSFLVLLFKEKLLEKKWCRLFQEKNSKKRRQLFVFLFQEKKGLFQEQEGLPLAACFKNRSSFLLLVSRKEPLFFCLFQEPLKEKKKEQVLFQEKEETQTNNGTTAQRHNGTTNN